MTNTTILLLLTLFSIKHFVADFVLQFPYMVEQKGTYGARGGIDHAVIQGLPTLLILLPFVTNINDAIILAAIDMVVHYHIDWAKMNISRGLTPADRKYWVWLGLDQLLHSLTYIGIAAAL